MTWPVTQSRRRKKSRKDGRDVFGPADPAERVHGLADLEGHRVGGDTGGERRLDQTGSDNIATESGA